MLTSKRPLYMGTIVNLTPKLFEMSWSLIVYTVYSIRYTLYVYSIRYQTDRQQFQSNHLTRNSF